MLKAARRPPPRNATLSRARSSSGFPAPRWLSKIPIPPPSAWNASAFSEMSSPNHLACSYASVWHPTQASSPE